jgi:tRNA wybutosine-synthesizing protein 4
MSSRGPKESHTLARFGANTVDHQGQTFIIGGIIRDAMLKSSDEVCSIANRNSPFSISRFSLEYNESTPVPLLIGMTTISTGRSLLVMGGSAVCFSFGTYWNKGSFVLHTAGGQDDDVSSNMWNYVNTIAPRIPMPITKNSAKTERVHHKPIAIARVQIQSSDQFQKILLNGVPVIIEGLDIGPCTKLWTPIYLKDRIGSQREV